MTFPEPFIEQQKAILGNDLDTFLNALQEKSPTSIRLNPAKKSDKTPIGESVKWNADGVYLSERPIFTLDPLFHAGAYYVQEASSMFVAEAMKQTLDLSAPLRVMDLCAAPGGKSTLIASLLNEDSLLVANEAIKSRVGVLKENLERWGFPNYLVSNHDPEEMVNLEGVFDAVLVDAPCSGEGLFRKDPKAMSEWSPENVRLCSLRQQRILQAAGMLVKHEGILIYSTCTYNSKENQQNVDWLCKMQDFETVQLQIPADWGITESNNTYQFFPHKTKGEGFFLAVLRKTAGILVNIKGKMPLNFLAKKHLPLVHQYFKNPEKFDYFDKIDGQVIAIPINLTHEYKTVLRGLTKRSSGLEVGQIKGNDFIPSHAFALSTAINPDLPAVDLSKDDALKFLKRESISQAFNTNGWFLVRYEGLNLGWLKVIGERINNYFPKEWRIRMDLD